VAARSAARRWRRRPGWRERAGAARPAPPPGGPAPRGGGAKRAGPVGRPRRWDAWWPCGWGLGARIGRVVALVAVDRRPRGPPVGQLVAGGAGVPPAVVQTRGSRPPPHGALGRAVAAEVLAADLARAAGAAPAADRHRQAVDQARRPGREEGAQRRQGEPPPGPQRVPPPPARAGRAGAAAGPARPGAGRAAVAPAPRPAVSPAPGGLVTSPAARSRRWPAPAPRRRK